MIIDGECYNSCIYLAVWADGKEIRTLEGLMGPGRRTLRYPAGLHRRGGSTVRILHPGNDHERGGDPGERKRIYKRRTEEAYCPAICADAPGMKTS